MKRIIIQRDDNSYMIKSVHGFRHPQYVMDCPSDLDGADVKFISISEVDNGFGIMEKVVSVDDFQKSVYIAAKETKQAAVESSIVLDQIEKDDIKNIDIDKMSDADLKKVLKYLIKKV